MSEVKVLGVDLAKSSFSVCGMSAKGKILFERTLSRAKFIEFIVQHPKVLVGFEACGSAHYWGRFFLMHGHKPKMMNTYSVKAFAPAHKKNDRVDAQAIAMAALQITMTSIRIKSTADQDIDSIQNYRDQLVSQRVALINQAHALCMEYGASLPLGRTSRSLSRIVAELEDGNNHLTSVARDMLNLLIQQATHLEEAVKNVDKKMITLLKEREEFHLLQSIPGVGPQTAATILSRTGGRVDQFKNGRQFAAYLGLVPRQYSTGGKTKLLGITKHGDHRIRSLLVLCARTFMIHIEKRTDKLSAWVGKLKSAKGFMKANIALANKIARIIYAVLKTRNEFNPALA